MDRNQASDKRNENEDLPGYPHYPSEEDILNPDNGLRKVRGDVEGLANSNAISRRTATDRDISADIIEDRNDDEDEVKIVRGTEADVTREDLENLGDRNADQDMGDDEDIQGSARVDNVDLDNDELEENDLDVPGDDQDDADENVGEEDEENNYYSLGGDNHENLEEDQA
ncbi:MAG: hypothetical protein H0X41_14055 [Chitinophagaceae bacterium]|nr:hypothetical protein [Chitinophagaceae bacterium]